MLLALLLYVGTGAILGLAAFWIPGLRRSLRRAADQAGMRPGYAKAIWFGGTLIVWPIGLYVLLTGRLLYAGVDPKEGEISGVSSATDLPPSAQEVRPSQRPLPLQTIQESSRL